MGTKKGFQRNRSNASHSTRFLLFRKVVMIDDVLTIGSTVQVSPLLSDGTVIVATAKHLFEMYKKKYKPVQILFTRKVCSNRMQFYKFNDLTANDLSTEDCYSAEQLLDCAFPPHKDLFYGVSPQEANEYAEWSFENDCTFVKVHVKSNDHDWVCSAHKLLTLVADGFPFSSCIPKARTKD